MGFKNSQKIRDALISLAGEKHDSNQTNKRILYMIDAVNRHSLPKEIKFDVVCNDMPSLRYRFFAKAKIGQDVLDALQNFVSSDIRDLGATRIFFCFDAKRDGTRAKEREQALRKHKNLKDGIKPYEKIDPELESDDELVSEFMELWDGTKVRCAEYQFGLAVAMPMDFDRVVATPSLFRRAMMFMCSLIEYHVVNPLAADNVDCGDVFFYISGRPTNRPKKENEDQIPDTHTSFIFVGDSGRARPEEKPSCQVGEAESQCFYHVRQMFKERQATRFLVRANDSDAIALGLLNIPHLIREGDRNIGISLWIDNTCKPADKRMIDVVYLWRCLKIALAKIPAHVVQKDPKNKKRHREAPAPTTMESLRGDIETVLAVAMLDGNDYCSGSALPQLGPVTLFSNLERGLITPLKEHGSFMVARDIKTGEMQINEAAMVAFIIRCYCGMSRVQQLLKGSKSEAVVAAVARDEHWAIDNEEQQVFFTELSAAEWRHGKDGLIVIPTYDQIRAHVRRAFFSLYYYTNVCDWQRTKVEEFLCDPTHLSLFGHQEVLAEPPFTPEQLKTVGLAQRVAIHGPDGGLLQPFLRSDVAAVMAASGSLSSEERDRNLKRRITTTFTEEYNADSKTPNETWTDPLAGRWVYEKARNESGEYGSHLKRSSSVSVMNED